MYECPILQTDVPLPVYIKNRQLIRERQVRTFQNKGGESFYSCVDDQEVLLERHGVDIGKNIVEVLYVEGLTNPENYRAAARENLDRYLLYKTNITETAETQRNHLLMSFITADCLKPSALDQLGSVAGSILNDRSSQAPSSIFTESMRSNSLKSIRED